MALVFADGFDTNPVSGGTTYGGWWDSWGTALASGSGLRANTGTFQIQCYNSSSQLYKDIGGTRTSLTAGFALSTNAATAMVGSLFRFQEGTTVHVAIGLNSNRAITVWRGDSTTVLTTSATRIIANSTSDRRWYYIEIEAGINDTTGYVKVWVDNNLAVDISGVDTQNGGTGVISRVSLGFNGTGQTTITDTYFDDFYCLDSTGAANNTRLGNVAVTSLRPTSDVSISWTPNSGATNYTQVDETQTDLDTTYVSSSTSGQQDIYGISNYPVAYSLSIKSVGIQTIARVDDATARSMKILTQIGGTTYSSSAQSLSATLSYSPNRINQIQELSPATGTTWTKTEIDGINAGIEHA